MMMEDISLFSYFRRAENIIQRLKNIRPKRYTTPAASSCNRQLLSFWHPEIQRKWQQLIHNFWQQGMQSFVG
jgi:hypothetical protein